MTTFPYGYTADANGVLGMGTQLTWDQMMTKATVYNLHPEVRKRFKALIHDAAAQGVPLGCGTGWRIQPTNKPGFASPGNSYHESCPVSPRSPTALAIDTVPNISWAWMELNVARYGLRTFKYLKEAWHIQPKEISASRNWATTLPALTVWDLPDEPTTPPPVTPPPATGGTFTLELQKNELTPAKREQLRGNGDVFLVQQIAQGHFKQLGNAAYDCGKPDGDYGPRTQDAVKKMQADGGLTQDAECGPKTWGYLLNKSGG